MNIFVREYSWMWDRLKLSLAECRIYAYIYGLSHGEKGGYDGSKRHLAELLGLPKSTACKSLDTLMEKHLIVCADGIWQSVPQVDSSGVPAVDKSVPAVDKSVPPVDSPHTPLYIDNNNKKKQADMQIDFEKFLKQFALEFMNRFAVTSYNWDLRSEPAQIAMWNAVKDEPDGSVNKNPYFFVVDFPEPQPEWKTGGETGEDLVQVRYNGAYKICTRDTMKLYGLEWVRDW